MTATATAAAAAGGASRWRGVGQASGGQGGGNGNKSEMGTCGYNSQKRGLLFICTLQRSLLVTSQILALSEVKAIILSGRYATRLVTYLLLPRVAPVVIPSVGVPPPSPP